MLREKKIHEVSINHRNSFIVIAVLLSFFTVTIHAQTTPVIYPGSDQFNTAVFEPFEAEYSQMNFPFTVRFQKIDKQGKSVFSTMMIMQSPNGIGVDHVGHFAEDFSFAYRYFDFGAYGREHIVIENNEDTLEMSRMPLEGGSARTMAYTRTELEAPAFDGTFVYWLLAGLPLEDGSEYRMNQWLPEEAGLVVRPTVPFKVIGHEQVTTEDGQTYDCQIVEAEGGAVKYVNYVADQAPYLIRQVALQPQQEPFVILELKSMRRAPR